MYRRPGKQRAFYIALQFAAELPVLGPKDHHAITARLRTDDFLVARDRLAIAGLTDRDLREVAARAIRIVRSHRLRQAVGSAVGPAPESRLRD